MKLITFFLIVGLMQVSASAYSQFLKVEFPQNSISVKDVLSTIEKNSAYKFLYRNDQMDVNRLVEIESPTKTLDNILSQVLNKTNLAYTILENNLIVIAPEQQKKLTGTVVDDANGEPLIGVTIMIEGTTSGTVTDINGKYSLPLPSANVVIKVSYLGYLPQIINVKGLTRLDIRLTPDVKNLDEVIVVGYGTAKKRDVTGAITRVSEKTFKERPVANAVQAMQGKVTGVDIVSNVRPGQIGSVNIRGYRSFRGGNDPLYVLDGIVITGTGMSMNDINPNDISSIEILKDASATAIYGSRAANGVILITTKKGAKGALSLTYEASLSLDRIHSLTKWASAGESLDRMRLTEINGGTYKTGTSISYPDPFLDITKFGNGDYYTISAIRKGYQWTDGTFTTPVTRAATQAETDKGWPAQVPVYNSGNIPSTDWTGLMAQTAATQNHLLSLSAGNEISKIYLSFGYLNNPGTQKNQNYDRYTLKVNGDINPVKWLTTGVAINATSSKQQYGTINRSGSATGAQDSYGMALGQYRMAQPYDSTGTMILYPGNNKAAPVWNPFIDLQNSSDERKINNIQANLYTELTLTPWLKYRMNFGTSFRYQRNGTWQGSQSTLRRTGNPQTATASYSTSDNTSYLMENLLYFNKSFGKHTIGATLMQSAQRNKTENANMAASGITNDIATWYDLSANNSSTGPSSYGTGYTETDLLSYMGRINYLFADKYVLTATGRFDGASVFAEGHKWDFFPSVAVAWKMQEESFIKPIHWINELKLRAGWGSTGNSAVDPYTSAGPLSLYKYVFGTSSALGYQPYNMPNPLLGWEKTAQYNLGFDFGILKNRISGTIEVYQSNTTNNLMDRNIPAITGYPFITANIGKMRNTGLEISLSTINVQANNFRWTTDLNWSTNKEEVVELVNGKQDMVGNLLFIGQPMQVFRTYQTAGIWQNSQADLDEIAKWKTNGYNFAPGQYKPKEQGTPNYKLEDNDKVIRGTVRPKWVAGFTNTFSYKNFELSTFIYARIGQSYYSSLQPGGTGGLTASNFIAVGYMRTMDPNNFWSPQNQGARWSQPTSATSYNADIVRATYINDGSFVSVRNISLTYSLSASVLSKLNIKKFQIYGQVLNPFIFGGEVIKAGLNTDDETGWAASNSLGDNTGGANNNTMILKSWVFGVRVTF